MLSAAYIVFSLLVTNSVSAFLERLEEAVFFGIPEEWSDPVGNNLSRITPRFIIYDKPSDHPLHTIPWNGIAGPEPLHVRIRLRSASRLTVAVHGFRESSDTEWMQELAKLRSADEGAVVLLLDWRRGAEMKRAYTFVRDYTQAASYVPLLGAALASLVRRLMKTYSLHPDRVDVVGFSLGGQIGGYFTKHLMESGIKISRFAALDVAAPNFIDQGIMPSKKHVQFLEVVHTSASDGSMRRDAEGLLGIDRDFGHVDFYPNGGRWQPGCSEWIFTACHHRRAYELYLQALREETCRLRGAHCNSYEDALKGECESRLSTKFAIGMPAHYCTKGTPCIFNVPTSGSPPFCHQ